MHTTCPHLPPALSGMSYRCLREHPPRTAGFYLEALRYSQFLWQGHAAGRAILALTRALYAPPADTDAVLKDWPLPYHALGWMVAHHSSDEFPGNPRISYQHQATRMRGANAALRRTRAWACWTIVRRARPTLAGDHTDPVDEPTAATIANELEALGHQHESALWLNALAAAVSREA